MTITLESKHGKVVVPGTGIKLLSDPSKMPGLAWGIAAGKWCPGAVYGPNSICGSCYARNPMSRYASPNVKRAHEARMKWTMECLMTAEGREFWVAYMTAAIARHCKRVPYFRIHDSGDMFSPAYVQMWDAVAANLPGVKFWAPTRSYHRTPRILSALILFALRPNVTVRPSALHFDAPAPLVYGLHAGSTAGQDFNCPASLQGNACQDCRACWNDKSTPITYHKHGREVKDGR